MVRVRNALPLIIYYFGLVLNQPLIALPFLLSDGTTMRGNVATLPCNS